jgi:uncharacterized repeat protein (TIGR03843 family)
MSAPSEADALELLRHGRMEIEGRLVDASNTTLRATLELAGVSARCVYKPIRGERPLWDFPDGTLAGREASAYLVADATGWSCVPPTVLRENGPLGPGACQLWIDEPEDAPAVLGYVLPDELPDGWHRIMRAHDSDGTAYLLAHADDPRLARLAVFDAVVNNADRKGGHILSTVDGGIRGVDHGVCFSAEPKLRTVLWGWIDDPLPADAVEVLSKLRAELLGALGGALAEHLTITEVDQIGARVDALLTTGRFPSPSEDWPAVPWPPV